MRYIFIFLLLTLTTSCLNSGKEWLLNLRFLEAAMEQDPALIKSYLEEGADPNLKNNNIPVWIYLLKSPAAMNAFLKHGVKKFDINNSKYQNHTVISGLADPQVDNLEPLKTLLELYRDKIDLNNIDNGGSTITARVLYELILQRYNAQIIPWTEAQTNKSELFAFYEKIKIATLSAKFPEECKGEFTEKYNELYKPSSLLSDWKNAPTNEALQADFRAKVSKVFRLLSLPLHADKMLGKPEAEIAAARAKFEQVNNCKDKLLLR